jgi:nitrite reductase/ring-hydroxylating ferredoxin subunit
MSETAQLVELCKTVDVPAQGALKVETAGLVVAVFNVNGRFFVTDDACTHGPGSLSEGCLEDDIIECDFHNGAFNVRTGAVVAAPCVIPLRTYAVSIVDDAVWIDPTRHAIPDTTASHP